ncbi:hypothetical protein SAMN02799631_04366 [Methylobacterium sp. 174MFSha1.1]|uniref:hypothetical protein n=1 Tax=Methylobacterium sp. 174MFSha1.1 TaxID=1502749 RepID=UPI0008E59A73|nr:hypothetical protein [Methylobacterium sp. 174MFSha1.1]SFV06174.1 hypothetical protein SAMN02799631_04366 [Methylobacterium sp. 174MFSha1.1]
MLHVPGMPEGVHVSFSPEDQPVSSPAQPERYTPPRLVGAGGTPSDALTALLDAHELAYGHALCSEAYGLPDLAERRQAEEEAFRALLHTPMHSDADRVAYAIAVISRQMYSLGDASATERDHPMAVAYRNLRFGEHAREPEEMRRVGRPADPETAADPTLSAIAASKAATAAFDAFEAELERYGKTSGWAAREGYLSDADLTAQKAVWKTVPTTLAGRRALVEYARAQVQRRTHPDGDVDDSAWLLSQILDAFAAMVDTGSAVRSLRSEASDASALIDVLEREWAAEIVGDREDRSDLSAEADARSDARMERRDALMAAAEALPAGSREARHAKALAFAWDASIMLWKADWTRDQYGTDGRLMIDLMDSLTGEPRVAHAAIPEVVALKTPNLNLSSYSVSQLCALFGVYERAEDHFYSAAWWPKLGETGSSLVTDEGDRCMALKDAVADELQKRKPVDTGDADERGEILMRRMLLRGDWDATAHQACSLRNEVAACQGKH